MKIPENVYDLINRKPLPELTTEDLIDLWGYKFYEECFQAALTQRRKYIPDFEEEEMSGQLVLAIAISKLLKRI